MLHKKTTNNIVTKWKNVITINVSQEKKNDHEVTKWLSVSTILNVSKTKHSID